MEIGEGLKLHTPCSPYPCNYCSRERRSCLLLAPRLPRGGCCQSPLKIMILLGQSEETVCNNGTPRWHSLGGLDSAVSHLQPRAIKSIYTKAVYHKPFEKLSKEEIYPSRIFILFFLWFPYSPIFLSFSLTTSGNLWDFSLLLSHPRVYTIVILKLEFKLEYNSWYTGINRWYSCMNISNSNKYFVYKRIGFSGGWERTVSCYNVENKFCVVF